MIDQITKDTKGTLYPTLMDDLCGVFYEYYRLSRSDISDLYTRYIVITYSTILNMNECMHFVQIMSSEKTLLTSHLRASYGVFIWVLRKKIPQDLESVFCKSHLQPLDIPCTALGEESPTEEGPSLNQHWAISISKTVGTFYQLYHLEK